MIHKKVILLLIFVISLSLLVNCAYQKKHNSILEYENKYSEYTRCNVRYIKQHSEYDCGLACLTAVARTWDIPVEVLEKNILESENNKGTYLHELKSLSESIGLKSFQLVFKDAPKDDLIHHLKLGRPLICPLNLPVHRYGIWNILLLTKVRNALASWLVMKKNHYVVVFGYSSSKDRVLIMDPARGYVTLSWREFEGYWARNKHAVLLCSK